MGRNSCAEGGEGQIGSVKVIVLTDGRERRMEGGREGGRGVRDYIGTKSQRTVSRSRPTYV